MRRKTFIETGRRSSSKDTIEIVKNDDNMIEIWSSTMNGRHLLLSKDKSKSIANYILEVSK